MHHRYNIAFVCLLLYVGLFYSPVTAMANNSIETGKYSGYHFLDGTWYKFTADNLEEYLDKYFFIKKDIWRFLDWNRIEENAKTAINDKEQAQKKEQQKEKESSKVTIDQNIEIKEKEPEESKTKTNMKDNQEDAEKHVQKNDTKTKTESINQDIFENSVVELTNQEREKYGLGALKMDVGLAKVAREKSHDMMVNQYFAHQSPTYGTPFEMMDQFGVIYSTAGENIAKGQRTPKEVVTAWMNSPSHRENILNESFTHIGIGFIPEGYHWTQQFISKADESVSPTEYENKAIKLINQEREKNGLAPLIKDEIASKLAREKSKDMYENEYFEADNMIFEKLKQKGVDYKVASQNITMGYISPEKAVQSWMESFDTTILDPQFTHIGVGYHNTRSHWTLLVIGK